jgi:diguanylate cyclase (GGDEF)-like protein
VSDPVPTARSAEHAYSCALSATLVARVRRVAGKEGVERLLREAGSERTVEYLEEAGNWIGFDEAIALWDAGEAVTRDPHFARHAAEDSVKVLGGTATATVLRSFGSPEEYLPHLDVAAQRYSNAAELAVLEVRPGYAEVRLTAAPRYVLSRHHCEWTTGMLSLTTVLFGLEPAHVEHSECQVLGAPCCRYDLTWDPTGAGGDESGQVEMLREQLKSLSERLEGIFATAADLISTGDLDDTLSRIADRAAQQVRAPKYLLAVRPIAGAEVIRHQKGLDDEEASAIAERAFAMDAVPESWCVAEIKSRHRDYGRLVAMYHEGAEFFPQERELLELYARYAATALDSATALLEARDNRDEAQRRNEEARALLDLARRLASAGSSDQIASRLVDAIPAVVDCDRVSVSLWDEEAGELVRRAVNATGWGDEEAGRKVFRPEDIPQLAAWVEHPQAEPHFIDMESSPIREPLREVGAVASVAVPIATARRLLGVVQVSVRERPERLAPSEELCDRLSGVAAHAVVALENGRLVDHITHQAHHDQLTGLANRLAFSQRMTEVTRRAADGEPKPFALFYVDLDRFKPVNDEFGHEVGDRLLRAVAERLHNCARPGDTVARLGGDEFAVIVEAIEDASHLDAIARRMSEAFSAPFVIDGQRLSIEASIGRAVWPLDAQDIEGLLREADATMYRAKRARPGRNGRDVRGSADAGPPGSPPIGSTPSH